MHTLLEHLKIKVKQDDKNEGKSDSENSNDIDVKSIEIAKQILDKFYLDELMKELSGLIIQIPPKKDKILKLTRIFVSELLFIGYSEEYLYHITKKFFFSKKKISSPNQINAYFSNFKNESTNWTVVFKGTPDFERIKKLMLSNLWK